MIINQKEQENTVGRKEQELKNGTCNRKQSKKANRTYYALIK